MISKYHTVAALKEVYVTPWKLIDPTSVKPDGTTLPPKYKKKSGRPPKKRLRSHGELDPKRLHKCKKCSEYGHNSRTCDVRAASRAMWEALMTPEGELHAQTVTSVDGTVRTISCRACGGRHGREVICESLRREGTGQDDEGEGSSGDELEDITDEVCDDSSDENNGEGGNVAHVIFTRSHTGLETDAQATATTPEGNQGQGQQPVAEESPNLVQVGTQESSAAVEMAAFDSGVPCRDDTVGAAVTHGRGSRESVAARRLRRLQCLNIQREVVDPSSMERSGLDPQEEEPLLPRSRGTSRWEVEEQADGVGGAAKLEGVLGEAMAGVERREVFGSKGEEWVWGSKGEGWVWGSKGEEWVWGSKGEEWVWGSQGQVDKCGCGAAREGCWCGAARDKCGCGAARERSYGAARIGAARERSGYAAAFGWGDYGADRGGPAREWGDYKTAGDGRGDGAAREWTGYGTAMEWVGNGADRGGAAREWGDYGTAGDGRGDGAAREWTGYETAMEWVGNGADRGGAAREWGDYGTAGDGRGDGAAREWTGYETAMEWVGNGADRGGAAREWGDYGTAGDGRGDGAAREWGDYGMAGDGMGDGAAREWTGYGTAMEGCWNDAARQGSGYGSLQVCGNAAALVGCGAERVRSGRVAAREWVGREQQGSGVSVGRKGDEWVLGTQGEE
ncbi:unnamed protein product [Closterium sp. NIES-65]|nr:unnamed protein product [Closterium sp. NIES-65]